jgi:DNA (cytosine-5)-methyltransferase 1
MSWLFSRALVEEYLGERCLDGEQSVPLNGNHIPQAYCAPDKMTKFSKLSRFGMTFKPLTESRGEELLTLYLEDFHAKTLAQQEKVQVLTECEAECGEKWQGSFAKYDQSTHSLKTHQCSLFEDSTESCQTLPAWGLMRDGECWEQQTLERTIKGTESGLSPNGVDSFHTPNCTGLDGGSNSRKALKKKMEKWPTPQSRDYKGSSGRSMKGQEFDLPTAAKKWPIPTMRDYKGANGFETTTKKLSEGLRAHMGQLPNAIQHMEQKPIGGTLNPTWVEWLMGWPLGWTDLKPLETDKCHCVQQQLGEF